MFDLAVAWRLDEHCPGHAYVLDAGAPVTALAEIAIFVIRNERRAKDSLELLERLADWLRTTPPEPKK
jgi:hypothetical protein